MKTTWKKSDGTRRSNLAIGFSLFVTAVAICAYVAYLERYVGEPQPALDKLVGWAFFILGLVVTVGSFAAASSGASNSVYLAYGAIIWGAAQFFRGVAQSKSQRSGSIEEIGREIAHVPSATWSR